MTIEGQLPESVRAEIDVLCYLVDRGKPAAVVAVKACYLNAAQDHVDLFGLRRQARKLSLEWHELWVFKYPHIGRVIAALPTKPVTELDHWVLGKLFGYEETAIAAFLGTSVVGSVALRAGRESV